MLRDFRSRAKNATTPIRELRGRRKNSKKDDGNANATATETEMLESLDSDNKCFVFENQSKSEENSQSSYSDDGTRSEPLNQIRQESCGAMDSLPKTQTINPLLSLSCYEQALTIQNMVGDQYFDSK